jgi:hypothetical protein
VRIRKKIEAGRERKADGQGNNQGGLQRIEAYGMKIPKRGQGLKEKG